MGLVRTQKIGEGMCIKDKNREINITILDIGGVEFNRKAKFKIEGVNGISELEICAEEGYIHLTDGIYFQISNSWDKREGFVSVDYDAPVSYKLCRKEDKKSKRYFNRNDRRIVNENHPVGFYYR